MFYCNSSSSSSLLLIIVSFLVLLFILTTFSLVVSAQQTVTPIYQLITIDPSIPSTIISPASGGQHQSYVVNESLWSSDNKVSQNFDTKLFFTGALPENTTLHIKQLKVWSIEVNTTLSRGCRLIIEDCEVRVPSVDKFDGGIQVAPTVFQKNGDATPVADTSQYWCGSVTSSSSSSSNSESGDLYPFNVTIIIRGNTIFGVARLKVLDDAASFNSSTSDGGKTITPSGKPSTVETSAITIFNLIVCHSSSSFFARPDTAAFISVEENDISIRNDDTAPSPSRRHRGISIYPNHRVSSSTLENVMTSNTKALFEMIVPLQSVSVLTNSFSFVSKDINMYVEWNHMHAGYAISIGCFWRESDVGWSQLGTGNFYLVSTTTTSVSSNNAKQRVQFLISGNDFFFNISRAVGLQIGTFGTPRVETIDLRSTNSLQLNFTDHKRFLANVTEGGTVINATMVNRIDETHQTSIYYLNNNNNNNNNNKNENMIITQIYHWQSGSRNMTNDYDHRWFEDGTYTQIPNTVILLGSTKSDTTCLVENSEMRFDVARTRRNVLVFVSFDSVVGDIQIKNTRQYQSNSNVQKNDAFIFLTHSLVFATRFKNIGDILVEGCFISASSTMDYSVTSRFIFLDNVTGVTDARAANELDPAALENYGVGNITFRKNSASVWLRRGKFAGIWFYLIPNVGHIVVEDNRFENFGSWRSNLLGSDLYVQLILIKAKSVIVRDNIFTGVCTDAFKPLTDATTGATYQSDVDPSAWSVLVDLQMFMVVAPARNRYVIERNIHRIEGAGSALLLRGGFMFEKSDPSLPNIIIQDNTFVSRRSYGIAYAIQMAPTTENGNTDRGFNLNEMTLKRNTIHLEADRGAAFISIGYVISDQTDQQLPDSTTTFQSNTTLVLEDNRIYLISGFLSLGMCFANLELQKLAMINTTFVTDLNESAPLENSIPDQAKIFPGWENMLFRQRRFGLFTKTLLKDVYLSASDYYFSSSSFPSSSSPPFLVNNDNKPCSRYNDEKITDRLLRFELRRKMQGAIAIRLFGDGEPASAIDDVSIYAGKCQFTKTRELSRSNFTMSISDTVSENETSPTKIPTRTVTSSKTNILFTVNADLPDSQKAASAAATSLAGVASLAAGPLVAIEAGKTLSLLGTIGRCQQFRETLRGAQKASSKDQLSQEEKDAISKQYARQFLEREPIEFPESLLGICIGEDYIGSPRCLRGSILGNYFFLVVFGVGLPTLVGMLMHFVIKKEKQQQKNVKIKSSNWMKRVMLFSRYPFTIGMSISVFLSTFSANAITFLAGPGEFILFSDRFFYGILPIFGCWLFPCILFVIYLQRNHLSPFVVSTTHEPFENNSRRRNSRKFHHQQQQQQGASSSFCERTFIKNPNLKREDVFQLEKQHLFVPTMTKTNIRRQNHGGQQDEEEMQELLLTPKFGSNNKHHHYHHQNTPKLTPTNAGGGNTSISNSSVINMSESLLQNENSSINVSSFSSSSLANCLLQSETTRRLVLGDFCWSQGSPKKSTMNGVAGQDILASFGSLINKFYGPLSRDLLEEYYLKKCDQENNNDETHQSTSTTTSKKVENDSNRHHAKQLALKGMQPWRFKIAPFTVVVNSSFLIITTACQIGAALNPQSCFVSLVVLTFFCLLSLLYSIFIRPSLAELRNYVTIVCDGFVLLAALLATIDFALGNDETKGGNLVLIPISQAMLYVSLVLTLISIPLMMMKKLISVLKIAVPCTAAQKLQLQRQHQEKEFVRRQEAKRLFEEELELKQGVADKTLVMRLLVDNNNDRENKDSSTPHRRRRNSSTTSFSSTKRRRRGSSGGRKRSDNLYVDDHQRRKHHYDHHHPNRQHASSLTTVPTTTRQKSVQSTSRTSPFHSHSFPLSSSSPSFHHHQQQQQNRSRQQPSPTNRHHRDSSPRRLNATNDHQQNLSQNLDEQNRQRRNSSSTRSRRRENSLRTKDNATRNL